MKLLKSTILFLSLSSTSPLWAMHSEDTVPARQRPKALWQHIEVRPSVSMAALRLACSRPHYIELMAELLRLRQIRKDLQTVLNEAYSHSFRVSGTKAARGYGLPDDVAKARAEVQAAKLAYDNALRPLNEHDRQIRIQMDAIFAEEARAEAELAAPAPEQTAVVATEEDGEAQ